MPWHRKGGRPLPPGVVVPDGCKYCPFCEDVLPVDRFYPSRSRYDGREAYCKTCRKAQNHTPQATAARKDAQRRRYLRRKADPLAELLPTPPPIHPSQFGSAPATGPEIIRWHDDDGMTFQQIADRLSISKQHAARLYKKYRGNWGRRTPKPRKHH